MTANRAVRFVGAGIETGGGTGPAIGATGALAMVAGDDSVRQAIILLLSTAPGERLMRPEYGLHLHRLLFAPNDDTTAGLAIHYVRAALTRWEPRIEIVDLTAGAEPEQPHRLTITLRYRVKASLAVEDLEFTIATRGVS